MSAVAPIRFVPAQRPGVIEQPEPALSMLRVAVPATHQPLWLRIAFIAAATVLITTAIPQPAVVSDVSHTPAAFQPFPDVRTAEAVTQVWPVERADTHELFSNGLRIENAYAVQNEQRFYQVLDRGNDMQAGSDWRSDPIGIVYHATESPQYPFDKEQTPNLQRVSKAILAHVRDKRSYNFLIDRFGRVFRIVEESDAANHAGNSIWADGRSVYLNLNSSFLAVAFETAGGSAITPAQVHAGRSLTQMLRSKYKIAAQNCVTHAQVSVNPLNMRLGYHTDWAAAFPFAEMGLPDNYDLAVASLAEFGFDYDDGFRKALGGEPWRGLTAAERQIERDAAAAGRSLEDHRRQLRDRYKRLYSALKLTGAVDEQAVR